MKKLTKEWIRRAGIYVKASDAVRAADRSPAVDDVSYGALIDARERAYEDLDAASRAATAFEAKGL